MLSIVWFHDDRDHPKGLEGLRAEDLRLFEELLPHGTTLISWRPTTQGTGVGAALLRSTSSSGMEQFICSCRSIEKKVQTELWIRDWTAQIWFVYARRILGPATNNNSKRYGCGSPN